MRLPTVQNSITIWTLPVIASFETSGYDFATITILSAPPIWMVKSYSSHLQTYNSMAGWFSARYHCPYFRSIYVTYQAAKKCRELVNTEFVFITFSNGKSEAFFPVPKGLYWRIRRLRSTRPLYLCSSPVSEKRHALITTP